MLFIIILAAVGLLDFLAVRYGADTRDAKDWRSADAHVRQFIVR